jgi:protein transport protein SEC24
MTTDRIPSNA